MPPKKYNSGRGGSNRSYGENRDNDSNRSYGKSRNNESDRSYDESRGKSRNNENSRSYGDRNNEGNRSYGEYRGNGGKKPYGKKFDGKRTYDKNAPRTDRRPDAVRDAARKDEPAAETREPDELPFLILGRNAVKEAIKSGRSIDRIEVVSNPDGSLREILSLARDRSLVIREVDKHRLDDICLPFGHGGKPGNHQGIVAFAAGVEYCSLQDILSVAKQRREDPFVIVLDGIMDPHNLGSIIRSAECAGAHGVVIGKRRSASVTAATVKASAGATEHVKIARVVNIGVAIDELKRAKLWVAGADMSGTSMYKQGLNGPLALVIGSEGTGLSRLVSEKCDFLVSIPQHGKIGSLNAGVAAGVLIFEKKRQDTQE
jgi:23S rRNA (guanosine2251-2'-O)-methyltransferase